MKGSAAAGGEDDVELLKAVAQAWHAQSGNPRAASAAEQGADDDGGVSGARRAGRGGPRRRPSRFKLEAAAAAAAAAASRDTRGGERAWDFAQSLWDTYELVAVARSLESGLMLADHHPGAAQERAATTREGEGGGGGGGRAGGGGVKRARESSRSLRSMFLRSSSRRFEEPSS